jgi:hypothetical protein
MLPREFLDELPPLSIHTINHIKFAYTPNQLCYFISDFLSETHFLKTHEIRQHTHSVSQGEMEYVCCLAF